MILLSIADNRVVQFITVTLIFIIVLAITYFTTRWVGSYQKKHMSYGNIKIVESMRLSNSKILEIINVGDKYFLIAVCKDTVTTIGEVEPIEVNNEEPIEKRETFGNVFGRFKIMNKEETNDEEK